MTVQLTFLVKNLSAKKYAETERTSRRYFQQLQLAMTGIRMMVMGAAANARLKLVGSVPEDLQPNKTLAKKFAKMVTISVQVLIARANQASLVTIRTVRTTTVAVLIVKSRMAGTVNQVKQMTLTIPLNAGKYAVMKRISVHLIAKLQKECLKRLALTANSRKVGLVLVVHTPNQTHVKKPAEMVFTSNKIAMMETK